MNIARGIIVVALIVGGFAWTVLENNIRGIACMCFGIWLTQALIAYHE